MVARRQPRERALEAVDYCEKRAVAKKAAAERIAAGPTLGMHDLDAAYQRLDLIKHQTDWVRFSILPRLSGLRRPNCQWKSTIPNVSARCVEQYRV